MNKKIIAVFFGGNSTEHEVSIITGLQALENIDSEKFRAFPVYISKDGKLFTGEKLREIESYRNLSSIPDIGLQIQPFLGSQQSVFELNTKSFGRTKRELINVDAILSCFHGGLGENGGFQALFEIMNIPYSGPGILGSSIGMDKIIMKDIFDQNGIPQTPYIWFYKNDWENNRKTILEKIINKLSFPIFIKPANGGSTIGVTKVNDKKELENAIEIAALFDRKIIAEENFSGRELNISVLGNSGNKLQVSCIEEVFPTLDLLTYEDKYSSNGKSKGMASTKREIPAKLKSETSKKIEELALKAFEALDLSGVSRIDFMINEKENKIVILEANTIPGSLSFYLWEPTGIKFRDLLTKLIDLAYEKHEESSKNIKIFQNNILENFKPGSKN